MEFLNKGQATFVFIIVIFLLSFSILILFGIILVKENNFSKSIVSNARLLYSQLSILNMALQEIFLNDYLQPTNKSFIINDINSFFSLNEINPESRNISGNIVSKFINQPFELRFNFQVEKNNQNLQNLRIFILD
ncbi:MAG: hypothetical protein KatS3mg094_252 [Candidatus Parcubacteria bacterium]|nr:MAG: hypothetical protein KatS3mg094_252 [Candidatus Parcubacteria bacterium]